MTVRAHKNKTKEQNGNISFFSLLSFFQFISFSIVRSHLILTGESISRQRRSRSGHRLWFPHFLVLLLLRFLLYPLSRSVLISTQIFRFRTYFTILPFHQKSLILFQRQFSHLNSVAWFSPIFYSKCFCFFFSKKNVFPYFLINSRGGLVFSILRIAHDSVIFYRSRFAQIVVSLFSMRNSVKFCV